MHRFNFLTATAVLCVLSIGASPQYTSDGVVESDATESESSTVQSENIELAQPEWVKDMFDAFDRLAEELSDFWDKQDATFHVEEATEEIVAVFVSLVEKYDSNNDGGLSITEFESVVDTEVGYGIRLVPIDKPQSEQQEFGKQLDRDEDGILTPDEVKVAMSEIFNVWTGFRANPKLYFVTLFLRYDSNGDGGISLQEFASAYGDDMTDEFKYISVEERRNAVNREFKELDLNADGKVTPDEVTTSILEHGGSFGRTPTGSRPPSTDKELQIESLESGKAD